MILSALSDAPAEGRCFHGLGSRKSSGPAESFRLVGQEVPEETSGREREREGVREGVRKSVKEGSRGDRRGRVRRREEEGDG